MQFYSSVFQKIPLHVYTDIFLNVIVTPWSVLIRTVFTPLLSKESLLHPYKDFVFNSFLPTHIYSYVYG